MDKQIPTKYKKHIKPELFKAICLWLSKNGDADHSVKLAGILTCDDVEEIMYMNEGNLLDPDTDNALAKKCIQAFGEVPTMTLYRGVSAAEKHLMLNAKTSILARPMSFSESKAVAKQFGDSIVTLKKTSIKLFDLSGFLANYNLAAALHDGGDIDEYLSSIDFEFLVGEGNEHEWLVPKDTKFKTVDKNKLVFEI